MSIVSVKLEGIDEVTDLIAKFAQLTGDTTALLDDMALIAINRVRARFLNAKDAFNVKWPVSQGAIDRASPLGQTVGGKTYLDGLTLFRSGKLFHSIQVRKPSPESRSIYTNMHYASYHNDGTNKTPKRTFLEWSEEDVSAFLQLVQTRLNGVA